MSWKVEKERIDFSNPESIALESLLVLEVTRVVLIVTYSAACEQCTASINNTLLHTHVVLPCCLCLFDSRGLRGELGLAREPVFTEPLDGFFPTVLKFNDGLVLQVPLGV